MTHILYHFAVCYVWQDSSGVIHVSGLDIVAGGYILGFSIMIDSNFYIGCSILFYMSSSLENDRFKCCHTVLMFFKGLKSH